MQGSDKVRHLARLDEASPAHVQAPRVAHGTMQGSDKGEGDKGEGSADSKDKGREGRRERRKSADKGAVGPLPGEDPSAGEGRRESETATRPCRETVGAADGGVRPRSGGSGTENGRDRGLR